MTGPLGKAETSTRSIPNSGSYIILTFLYRLFRFFAFAVTHLSVCTVLSQILCIILFRGEVHLTLFMSNPLWICLFLSVCLSVSPVLPSWAESQDIFPSECPTHVGSMSVSSRPSPHHHHTLDALWLPLQRAAWRHQWVSLLWSKVHTCHQFGWFVGICDLLDLSICFGH